MSVVANVAINVDSRGAVSKLREVNDAGSKLEQTFKGVDGKLRDSSGKFIKLGDSAQASAGKINVLGRAVSNLAASLAVADAARRYFKGFNEAEKAAAAVRTLGVDSKALEGNLLGLSQKLGGLFSQTQLLTAAYDVASSGFANAADNTKVLEAAAKGATGGLSDINTVGNAVTSVLNAYGKSADEAASLVDGFIQTQNDGKIILNEYAGLIGRLAPTAKAAGVGINEMNAAIATITAQGVPVEATFTGLNQALVSILKPSQEAEELAKSLGIQFNEAGLRAKGFGGLLEEVKTKTGGSTTQLVKLFGSVDALKAVLPLVNDDLVKYNQNVVKQANASGVAEKATQELGGTVSSEITKMINQIGNLVRSLDTVLGPALGGIVRLINFVIAEATKGIQVLGQLFSMSPGKKIAFEAVQSGNLGAVARVLPGIDETIGEERRKDLQRQAGAGTGFMGMGMDQSKFIKLLQQQPEFKVPATAGNKPAAVVDPALQALIDKLAAGGAGTGTGTGKGTGAVAKQERESQLADILAANGLFRSQETIAARIAVAEVDQNKAEVARLQHIDRSVQLLHEAAAIERSNVPLDERQAQLRGVQDKLAASTNQYEREIATEKIAQVKAASGQLQKMQDEQALLQGRLAGNEAEVILNQQIRDLKKEFPGLDEAAIKATLQQTNALKKQVEAAEQMKQVYTDIGMSIKDGVVGAIQGAIDGTKSLQEVASDLLLNIANKLLDVAVNLALFGAMSGTGTGGGLLGGLFKARAKGGPVSSGQTYMVGERGPELFVPGRSGTIVANDKMGGGSTNVVVNVDAKGSSVEGNEQGANQLGRVISAAVQSELIKQQRPGGILAR